MIFTLIPLYINFTTLPSFYTKSTTFATALKKTKKYILWSLEINPIFVFPMAKAMWLVLAVSMAVIALAPPQTEAAMSCTTVANDLSPCINYVLYGAANAPPPANCCTGIKTLYAQAQSTPDRQQVCSCLKSVASSASATVINNAASLPGKCGVSIPYKISPSTDCST